MNPDEHIEKRLINSYNFGRDNKPLITHFDIELTERCNSNCSHCYLNLPKNDRRIIQRELKSDRWKEIIKQAADLGVLTIRFTGGEPLIRDDFEELYLYTRELGIRVTISTNARLITPDLADLFYKIPPLDRIQISVYGMRAETYEAVTNIPGSFCEFWEGMNCLLERNVPFIVRFVLLPQNKKDIPMFEKWARNIPWMDRSLSYPTYCSLRARRDSSYKNERIKRSRFSPEEVVDLLVSNENLYRQEMLEFCSKFLSSSGYRLFSCGAGCGAVIDAYGVIQPCLLLRMPDLCCDLDKSSLREVMTEIFPRMRQMKAQNPEYLMKCAQCFIRGFCEQCPAKSWSEHGVLDKPVEYFCEVAHAQARFLGLLHNQENAWEVKDGQERIRRLSNSPDS